MTKLAALSVVTALAIASYSAPASAFVLTPVSALQGEALVQDVSFGCGPGAHPGYEDRFCWPNRHPPIWRACPLGFHLGYRDRHCWPNRY